MIEILLATYNGATYIEELLKSLLAQDCREWICTISDDGSTDDTISIIKKYMCEYPNHFRLLRLEPSHNAKDNFLKLLRNCESDYAMFCDQDDVWLPNKVSTMVREIKNIEGVAQGAPCLVFSDHIVVDQELNTICNSFMQFSGYDTRRIKLNQLVFENIIPGCSCIMNRNLIKHANMYKCAEAIRWHDWWVSIVAAATGEIHFLNEALTLYRQHGSNVVGAIDNTGIEAFLKRSKALSLSAYRNTHLLIKEQIRQVLELQNVADVQEQWISLVEELSHFENDNKVQRMKCLYRHKVGRKRRSLWTIICA